MNIISTWLTSAVLSLFADGHVLEHIFHIGTVWQRTGWRRWHRAHTIVELLLQLLFTSLTLVSVEDEHKLLLYLAALLRRRQCHRSRSGRGRRS